jgi:DNA-binding NarL/FixJ family response regulator
MAAVTVIIVDDHKIVRDGIKALFIGELSVKCIGEASDYDELEKLLAIKTPDLLLLDIMLPGKNGIEITALLKDKYPAIRVLILTSNTTEEYILDAVKAGAKGFLPKDTSAGELILAIGEVYSGNGYFGERINKIIYNSYIHQVNKGVEKESSGLSDRETEVLTMFADGFTTKEIAEKLFISPRTIDTHKANIMSKLNLNSIVDLVKYAIKNGLIKI